MPHPVTTTALVAAVLLGGTMAIILVSVALAFEVSAVIADAFRGWLDWAAPTEPLDGGDTHLRSVS